MLFFGVIFLIGFIVAIVTFAFGGDTDSDVSDGGDGDASGYTPNVLSVKMISLLVTGFGIVGFCARANGVSYPWSSFAGIGGAVFLGFFGYLIMAFFYRQQSSSTATEIDLIGAIGTVSDPIPDKGVGQVSCIIRNNPISYLARSKSQKRIEKGAQVKILSRASGCVYVELI